MNELLFSLLLVPIVGVALLTGVPVILTIERRGSAWIQRRSGPNRVGPWGLMQPLADAVKIVFKEENQPADSNGFLFNFAPVLAVVPPILGFALIPFGGEVRIGDSNYSLQIMASEIGVLLLLAITSLHVFSVLLAGWSSNNKFSLMGALRSGSQMISYEIAIGLSLVSLVLSYNTLDLREIVYLQAAGPWGFARQPLCFLIMWICVFAECNRLPFDLPEGESELVAGYHTEYSGLKFGMFFMGEYVAMYLASAFLATLFLGGFNIPFVEASALQEFFASRGYSALWATNLTASLQVLSFVLKMYFFMWVFVWVRWTLPRFRYDQLMSLGWKVLLPLAVVNVIATMLFSFYEKGVGF